MAESTGTSLRVAPDGCWGHQHRGNLKNLHFQRRRAKLGQKKKAFSLVVKAFGFLFMLLVPGAFCTAAAFVSPGQERLGLRGLGLGLPLPLPLLLPLPLPCHLLSPSSFASPQSTPKHHTGSPQHTFVPESHSTSLIPPQKKSHRMPVAGAFQPAQCREIQPAPPDPSLPQSPWMCHQHPPVLPQRGHHGRLRQPKMLWAWSFTKPTGFLSQAKLMKIH